MKVVWILSHFENFVKCFIHRDLDNVAFERAKDDKIVMDIKTFGGVRSHIFQIRI